MKDKRETNWIHLLNYNFSVEKRNEKEHDELCDSCADGDTPPTDVLPAPRLFDDLETLEAMFSE